MLNDYIVDLKTSILKVEEVKKNTLLKKGKWNKKAYEALSDLIYHKLNEKLDDDIKLQLGTTISPRTLYNIFEFKRKINYPLDQRVHTTLTKICLFAGWETWDDFEQEMSTPSSDESNYESIQQDLRKFIRKLKEVEYLCYHDLPDPDTTILSKYYQEDGSAIKEVLSNLYELNKTGWVISNPYNPSSIDLLQLEIKPQEEDSTYMINTEEYWIMCWYHPEEKKFIKRNKEIQNHTYIVKKYPDDNSWKVITNASDSDLL